jgi:enterochelin esterase-like enzyme
MPFARVVLPVWLVVLCGLVAGCGGVAPTRPAAQSHRSSPRPAPRTSSPAPASALRCAKGQSEGTYTTGSFDSDALNGTEHFSIYLPPGYDSSGLRYSTIYLLHGLPDNGTGWRSDRAERIGEDAARACHPVIVVAAQGARSGDTDPEWHDWGYGRDWESATAIDLVHYIDTHYRTIPNRLGRGLIGISAGGYGASIIGIHHLDEYSAIESWSGYFFPTNPAGTQEMSVGLRLEQARADLNSYVDDARELYARYHPFFGFFVGDQDSRFVAANVELDRRLTKAGVPHVFRLYHGGHSSAVWDAHEAAWTLLECQHLRPPQ